MLLHLTAFFIEDNFNRFLYPLFSFYLIVSHHSLHSLPLLLTRPHFVSFPFPYQLLSSSLSFLFSLMTNILFSFIVFSLYALILGLIMAVVTMPLETAKNRMAFQKPDKVTGLCRLIFFLNSCRTHFYMIYEYHKIKTCFRKR